MASQKFAKRCVAAKASLLRRTQVRLIVRHLRALHWAFFA